MRRQSRVIAPHVVERASVPRSRKPHSSVRNTIELSISRVRLAAPERSRLACGIKARHHVLGAVTVQRHIAERGQDAGVQANAHALVAMFGSLIVVSSVRGCPLPAQASRAAKSEQRCGLDGDSGAVPGSRPWSDKRSSDIVAAFHTRREGGELGTTCQEGTACKTTGSGYKSLGTIRMRTAYNDGANRVNIFFTPKDEYSVSHRGKKYAVFVALAPATDLRRSNLGEFGEGVPICVPKCLSGLVEAANKQCVVEIEVDAKCAKCPHKDLDNLEWTLRAITIPAAEQAK